VSSNKNTNQFTTRIGIVIAIIITVPAVSYSISKIVESHTYKFMFVTDSGDISNSISLIVGIISTILAVYLTLHLYKKQRFEARLGSYSDTLKTVIEPFIDNFTQLRFHFELFKESAGPYQLEQIKKKETNVTNIERINQRYNVSTNPDQSFITEIGDLNNLARDYPKFNFSQYSTVQVVIIDCSKCEEIHKKINDLLTELEGRRKELEKQIELLS